MVVKGSGVTETKMTKKILLLSLSLCVIPVVNSWGGGTTGITYAGNFLPQLDLDLSDLDVRDSQNRPVQSPLAASQLASLFRENLVEFTVVLAPHGIREAVGILDEISHLFDKLILNRVPPPIRGFLETFLPPERRFVHNVHNLWAIFSVGIFAASLAFLRLCDDRSPARINLRC
jgi:hypothetical protein